MVLKFNTLESLIFSGDMGQNLIKLATNWKLFQSNQSNESSGYLLKSFKGDFKVILTDLENKINQFGVNVAQYRTFSITALTAIGVTLVLLTLFLTLTRKSVAKLSNCSTTNASHHQHQNTRFSFRGLRNDTTRAHFPDVEKASQTQNVPFGQTY